MTATAPARSRYRRPPLWSRLLSRTGASTLPPATSEAGWEPDLEIGVGDVTLLADHYAPLVEGPRPTLLVRTPYGRRFPWGHVLGVHLAQRGYHVALVSTRGTAGSGGAFRPFRDDVADARPVLAWLRRQEWFDGRLGTIGPSYLGYTQLALAADPPPELGAMVLLSPAAVPVAAAWTNGVFALQSALVAGSMIETSSQGVQASARAALRLARRLDRAGRGQPLIQSYRAAIGGRADLLEAYLEHPDPADPFWAGTDLRSAVAQPEAPVLLVSGWWDVLLDQTLDLHARLVAAGRSPRLLLGPWTHTSMLERAGWPVVLPEVLTFLRTHLDGEAPTPAPPVRVHVGGDGWRELGTWPPPAQPQAWGLGADGSLSAVATPGPSSVIRYDPGDPTPFAGGAVLGRGGGVADQRRVERRGDVLVFTSAPLEEPLEVLGTPRAELLLRVDGPGADVVVRLCDVDPGGVSRNVTDGITRVPGDGRLVVPLAQTAHRFTAGHRLRVQVAPAAYPRYARATGTDEPLATAVGLAPVTLEVRHDPGEPSVLLLPRAR
jgi:putative CocE/NonD family hydrolase